ncbi:MAG: gamma-glutamyltransferase [Deltaproteobacteria bacterium]|jgi:gamma-glutamyltranspeptidase/glutathione hydrolase|nr:gamma-glutamyltransferase [Deltaproteobacteria bacterium]MBW2537639.1 gamma-glutamyltransferase [Deltaproteobacteria bacterium]
MKDTSGSARAIIAAGHPATAQAARIVVEAGGNAFDAVVAAGFAACVAEPVLASLGGAGVLLARPAEADPVVYDFSAHTPVFPRPVGEIEFVRTIVPFGTTSQEFHVGMGAAAVPGMAAGLFRVQRDLCRLSMPELVSPAAELGRRGIEVNRLQAYLLAITAAIYRHTDETARIYGSARQPGHPVLEGEVLAMPDLASTMELLAQRGIELLYGGELGREIAAYCLANGGQVSQLDLARYYVTPRPPLQVGYRDATVLLNPPPASGGALVAFSLKLLEQADLAGLDPEGARWLALVARGMEQTNAARAAVYDGREQDDAVVAELLADAQVRRYAAALAPQFEQRSGTTHISVLDAAGNAASMTITNGEECGHVVPGTGIMLNNMLGEEDVHPQGFHRWQPGTRISSMMAPSMATRASQIIVTGSGGSNRIRTCILQVLLKLLDAGWSVDRAVNGPRIHFEGGLLSMEGGFDDELVAQLGEQFSQLQRWEERNLFFGGAHTVMSEAGRFSGAGDARRGGVVEVID